MNHRLSYWIKLARACVAIAAAYALALQVMLLSVTAASMAMTPPQADALVICYGSGNQTNDNGSQPRHSPAGFAECALTCAQGLSAAAILPSDVAPAFLSLTRHPVEQTRASAFVLSPRPSPKLAQGPPQSA